MQETTASVCPANLPCASGTADVAAKTSFPCEVMAETGHPLRMRCGDTMPANSHRVCRYERFARVALMAKSLPRSPSDLWLPPSSAMRFADRAIRGFLGRSSLVRRRARPQRAGEDLLSGRQPSEQFPVIVFSTGLGRSRDDCAYLGRHWASCGYVSVHVQHKGSDEEVRQGSLRPRKELQRAFYAPKTSATARWTSSS